tara:strand:+ start:251 stop:589 length:339 start_codon:yes stop_codon:yes gene_type:complete
MSFTESNSLYSYAATAGIAGVSYAFGPSIAATGLMKTLFGASTFLLSFASYAVIPVLALATYAAYNYFTAEPESTIDQDERANTVTAEERRNNPDYFYYFYFDEQRVKSLGR